MTTAQRTLLTDVEQFLYREARLADEHDYDAWEALWTDDAIYWIPAGEGTDPTRQMSIVFDNRARIATRVAQLHTGKRYAANPASSLRHLTTNVEILDPDPEHPDDIRAGANVLVAEARERGTTFWVARTEYRLRETPDGLRLAFKKVQLVNSSAELPTLGFLL